MKQLLFASSLALTAAILGCTPNGMPAKDPSQSQAGHDQKDVTSPTHVEVLMGGQAVVFHNLCTVYVEGDPGEPLWLVRWDSPGHLNGGYTGISRDPEGVDVVITDSGQPKKSGLRLDGDLYAGESFRLVEPLGLAAVEHQQGLDRVRIGR